LNCVLRLFKWFLVRTKPDLLVMQVKIEPQLIMSDNELPILMFD
jgi:hypothetical protein